MITLDPTNLSDEDAKVLKCFLDKHPQTNEFLSGRKNPYHVIVKDPSSHACKKYSFYLTACLTRYFTAKEHLPRIAVYSPMAILGRGGFGEVYRVTGSLRWEGTRCIYTPKIGTEKARVLN